MKLSATLITLNEEKNVKRCLNSIKELADEIVVVDSGSRDNTVKIAETFGCQVFTRKFDNFASQRNYALSRASGEWILSLDADEEIPEELSKEIKAAIKSTEFSGYLIPRKNILLGGEIKHTRWSPDKHIWLFKKDKGRWVGKIHEEIKLEGAVGELTNAKIHHSYETVSDFLGMVNKYTEFEASRMLEGGGRFSFARFVWDPIYMFLLRYCYKKGFLDGWRGFVLSFLMGTYQMVTWVKVWEKQE